MIKRYRVTILGHYGDNTNAADGQTVKTRVIKKALVALYGQNNVQICDTHQWRAKPVYMLIRCVKSARNTKSVVMLPAQKGLYIFVPLMSLLKKLYKIDVHYSVIGGWLPEVVSKHKYLRYFLRTFDTIQVETSEMKRSMNSLNLDNVHVVPNFKSLNPIKHQHLAKIKHAEPLKLCTFSRVTPNKGIEDIIRVVISINDELASNIFNLDIYGEVDENYKSYFSKLLKLNADVISYKGVIKSQMSTQVLKNYYLLVFPTLFKTEGVPGTVIDAYAAGLPVLSSRWDSFDDVIYEGVTGYGFELGNNNDLYKALKRLRRISHVEPLKQNCLKAYNNYSFEEGCRMLSNHIGEA